MDQEGCCTSAQRSEERLTVQNVRDNIVGIDAQVPLLDGSHRTYVNLDNAASTPALRPVFDTVNEFLSWYSSVHRGTGFKSQVSTRAYEDAHEILCDFVGADRARNAVIFGKNSTEALNKLARRLPLKNGSVVLTTEMEHHSNDLPWRAVAEIEHVSVTRDGALDEVHLDHLLTKHRGRVRLVAVSGASNVTGTINPIHRIAERVHAAGAEVLVDGAQLAPHRAIDMRPDDDPGHIDYLVLSAHKMYAPYGTGALIGRRDTFLQGDPDMVGGGTVDMVTLDQVQWAGLPDREEAGSPNVVGAVALAKAIQCLQRMGMETLAEHEAHLTAYLLERLLRVPGVRVFGNTDPARAAERVGVIPFVVDGMSHHLVAAILSAEGGIGVRNGCFCAHPYLLRLLGVSPQEAREHQQEILRGSKANLPGLVRISFGCYNTEAEVDWLIEALERIVRGEYKGTYVQDPATGEFHAQGSEPEWADYFEL
jgi:cysteine desulfurase/selenocysteine lyase